MSYLGKVSNFCFVISSTKCKAACLIYLSDFLFICRTKIIESDIKETHYTELRTSL